MPAPEVSYRSVDTRPVLGHVNLMLDTFIANATPDDLRSIMRNLLATGPPGIAPAFTNAARSRLRQTNCRVNAYPLFHKPSKDASPEPSPHLHHVLTRARSMYGAGMGFASLGLLASIVRATIGLRWEEDGVMADFLAVIDSDITQAIQSSKEEVQSGRLTDFAFAREAKEDLRSAVSESNADAQSWGGEFAFERAASCVDYWKL